MGGNRCNSTVPCVEDISKGAEQFPDVVMVYGGLGGKLLLWNHERYALDGTFVPLPVLQTVAQLASYRQIELGLSK